MKSGKLLCFIAVLVFTALAIHAGPAVLVAATQGDELHSYSWSSGRSGASATLSPTRLLFRCRNVPNAGCQCINTRTATLSNPGKAPLDIKGISTTGAFTQASTCGASLAAGKSCTITVRWSLADSAGTLDVSDNASGSPQKVTLSGYKECSP